MIAHISGQLVQKNLHSVVVDVSGIGYEILSTGRIIDNLNLNDDTILYTHHHIREQSEELFGFDSPNAKNLFEQLITVNGIGPKAGLAIMNIGPDQEIRNAIASSDASYIATAKGVGKKGAEKLVLELKDKVGGEISGTSSMHADSLNQDDALDALLVLGYSKQQSVQALSRIDNNLSTEEKIKQALKDI